MEIFFFTVWNYEPHYQIRALKYLLTASCMHIF